MLPRVTLVLVHNRDEIRPGVDAGLCKHPGDVILDRPCGENQALRNGSGGKPRGEKLADLDLARREHAGALPRLSPTLTLQEFYALLSLSAAKATEQGESLNELLTRQLSRAPA